MKKLTVLYGKKRRKLIGLHLIYRDKTEEKPDKGWLGKNETLNYISISKNIINSFVKQA